jgi:cell division control protein 6
MEISDILKQEFKHKNQIIIDNTVFEDSNGFIPNEILHRDDQIRTLVQILKDAENGDKPNNVFIYGKPGTGKTLCTQAVLSEIEKLSDQIHVLYCNMNGIKSLYALIQKLANTLTGDRVKGRGTSLANAYETLWNNLNMLNGVLILVLDEIDNVDTSDLLYALLRFQHDYLDNLKISIVGISNSITFTEKLDPRVKSSLGEENLIFPTYNAEQIGDILRKRANQGIEKGSLDEVVIPLCAAIATQESGDARLAIQLLRTAALLAQRQGMDYVKEIHVNEARAKIERDHVTELILDLPTQSKLVLISMIFLHNKGVDKPSTTEVYDEYIEVARYIGSDVLSHRRITDYISEMVMMDIVDINLKYKGRYGRSNKNTLLIDKKIVLEKLFEDYRFISFKNYKI